MNQDNSRTTILVISMGFLVLYKLFAFDWAIIVSLMIGVLGIVSKTLSSFIELVWMKLAKILSYIIPSIIMMIIFYFILFPLSVISKLFTKDPLMLSKKYDSYFITVNREFTKQSIEKLW